MAMEMAMEILVEQKEKKSEHGTKRK